MYYYLTNLQGDVVMIVDAAGTVVASYTYNAWGEVLTATGTLAPVNPLRYRGYYYDSESGFYYVKSRYYDPRICRFINADDASGLGVNGDFASVNLFAYCGNNPVSRKDDGGEFWHIVIGAVVGGLISGITTYLETGDLERSVDAGLAGAATGALCAAGGFWVLGGALVSGAYTAATTEGDSGTKLEKGGISALSTLFWGYFGNGMTSQLKNDSWYLIGEFVFDSEFGTVAWMSNKILQDLYDDSKRSSKSDSMFGSNGRRHQVEVVA